MCILRCILKHRILRKIRATFLSLSEEKKATSAGLKRLRRSRRPLAYSLLTVYCSVSPDCCLTFTVYCALLAVYSICYLHTTVYDSFAHIHENFHIVSMQNVSFAVYSKQNAVPVLQIRWGKRDNLGIIFHVKKNFHAPAGDRTGDPSI